MKKIKIYVFFQYFSNIYTKIRIIMACACKAKKLGQVTAVKQVVKKNASLAKPVRIEKPVKKRVMFKRPI